MLNRKLLKNKLIVFVFASLSTFALTLSLNLPADARIATRLLRIVPNDGLVNFVFFVFILLLFNKYLLNKSFYNKHSIIFSLCFSILLLFGNSMISNRNFDFIFHSGLQLILSFFILIGYFLFFNIISNILIQLSFKFLNNIKGYNYPFVTRVVSYFDNKKSVYLFLFFILMWSPFILINFPGIDSVDIIDQIQQFLGGMPWSTHHPIFGSIIYGSVFSLGRMLINDRFGFFLIIMMQASLLSLAFTIAFNKMKEWNIQPIIRFIAIIYWAFNLQVSTMVPYGVKDILMNPFMILFVLYFIDVTYHILSKNTNNTKSILLSMLFGVIASLIRNDAIYVVILSYLVLIPFAKVKYAKLYIAFSLVVAFGLNHLIKETLDTSFHATHGHFSEALSIPLQQTARFIRDYPEDITPHQREVLSNLIQDFDEIGQLYTPNISDSVKNRTRHTTLRDWVDYPNVWFEMFLKHPRVYFEATFANTFLYYAPISSNVTIRSAEMFGLNMMGRESTTIRNDHERWTAPMELGGVIPNDIRLLIGTYSTLIARTTPINFLLRLSTFTWAFFFMMMLVNIRKQKKYLVIFAPMVFTLLVCIASPVNGENRYFWPIITMLPIVLAMVSNVIINPYKSETILMQDK